MNDPSCVLSSNFLGDDVMGYISHPNVISSRMLVFLPYHTKWGGVLSNLLLILHLWTSYDVSDAQNHFFEYWLPSRRTSLTILCIIMLCISLFLLIQNEYPPVVSMDIFNSSTIKLVTFVEFSKAPSSSTLIFSHGCC